MKQDLIEYIGIAASRSQADLRSLAHASLRAMPSHVLHCEIAFGSATGNPTQDANSENSAKHAGRPVAGTMSANG